MHSVFLLLSCSLVDSKENSIQMTCVWVSGNPSEGLSSTDKLIPAWIILGIVVIAAAIVTGCVLWKKQKRAACSMPPDPTGCTVPDESGKTIYSQIGGLPPEIQQTGTKKTQPQRKTPKAQDGLHTVYASVVQPKPMTLQTDEEEVQLEGLAPSEKSDKTIYSTVTKPQETEDPSIKTVYDTVNAPRRPEAPEFRKLL